MGPLRDNSPTNPTGVQYPCLKAPIYSSFIIVDNIGKPKAKKRT